jgi:hypothetical protein
MGLPWLCKFVLVLKRVPSQSPDMISFWIAKPGKASQFKKSILAPQLTIDFNKLECLTPEKSNLKVELGPIL